MSVKQEYISELKKIGVDPFADRSPGMAQCSRCGGYVKLYSLDEDMVCRRCLGTNREANFWKGYL